MGHRTDLLNVERAIRHSWNIPPDEVEKALELIAELLSNPSSTEREKLRAKKTLEVIRGAK